MATGTRERILDAGCSLLQSRGYHGTGIKQILAEADAAFASLYHFFPGGKEQLATEAIRRSGTLYQELAERVLDAAPDLVTGIEDSFAAAADTLRATDYADACPIATVALEVASTDEALRQATAEVFESWISALTQRIVSAGADPAGATRLALCVISLLEGAFVLSRALRSTEPVMAAGRAAAQAARELLNAPPPHGR
jgi:AcrR family transcriptional regulator